MINQDGIGPHEPAPSNLPPPYPPPPGAAPPNYGTPPPYGGAPYPGHYPPQKSNKGLVIALASALGALLLVGIIVLVVWLSGGFGSSSRSSSGVTSTASEGSGWLQGPYWKKSCTADEAIAFDSAGQVTIYERGTEHVGTYTLTGSSLSMTVEGRTATMQVRPSGRSMQVSGSSGPPNGTYLRCSSPARNGAPLS